MTQPSACRFYEFGPFRLDTVRRRLWRADAPVPLSPKAFAFLQALVEAGGEMVEKDVLMQRLWPDTIVEEANLTVHASAVRKALGERLGENQYIVTASGRGYRFVAAITALADTTPAPVVASPAAMAVLPFVSFGLESSEEYLGLGIADALITRLSQLRQIAVRPTSAVRRYLGQDTDAIAVGQALRVASVLEGNLRRTADRLRVTVQLVQVEDGRTLWAGKFDASLTDLFAIEDQVSEQVAAALILTLTHEERARLAKRATDNAAAYQLYLKGRYHAGKWTPEGFQKGIEYFEQALQQDANYALAYCGWADALILMWSHGYLSSAVVPQIKALVTKALALDDALGEAHASLGLLHSDADSDAHLTEQEFRRALELSPHNPVIHDWYALYLKAQGRHAEAIAANRRAVELDPLSPWHNATLAWAYYFARQYEQALAQCWQALEIEPNFGITHWTFGVTYLGRGEYPQAIAALEKATQLTHSPHILATLGYAYAVAGQPDRARQVIAQLQPLQPAQYVPPYPLAIVYAGLGDADEALAWLEKAQAEREVWMAYLNVYPIFDPLRADARFTALLRRW